MDNAPLVKNPNDTTSFYPDNVNVTYTIPALKHYFGLDIPL